MAKKNNYYREQFLRHELARHSTVMLTADIIDGSFNDFFQVYMERPLVTEECNAIFRTIGENQQIDFSLSGSLNLMAPLEFVANLPFYP